MATIFEKLDNWEAGKYDKYLECARVLKDTFNGTILAALVIDDVGDDFGFSSINYLVNNGINSKYIDLSVTGFGDYGRFLKELSRTPKLEGILLDNIDRIPGNADTGRSLCVLPSKKSLTSRFPQVHLSASIKCISQLVAKHSQIT
jgi:hypothetical protein